MTTERNAMGSELRAVTDDDDSTTKKTDESPPKDDTRRTVTGSSTSSVTVRACASVSDVVSSQPNENGQACSKDFLKAGHRDKSNSSYNYRDSSLHGDRAIRSNCWSQTSVSAPKPQGTSNVYGKLPTYTQSHALRPPFKGKQGAGQFRKYGNQKTSSVPYSDYSNGSANSGYSNANSGYSNGNENGYSNGNANSGYSNGNANSGYSNGNANNGYSNGNASSGFWDHRDETRKPERNVESDSLVEMKCGPRTSAKTNPSSESSSLKQNNLFALDLRRAMFNLPDFETKYEDAKFFVIKSYSEDDVHKSIKYSVWSSTVNGNKKLDAAFRDAEAKTLVDGKKRPVFLFFSVNASRQFVGLAEMVGYVDLNKDLDFWQVDKWCGFFPVEWHVVKDVPNWELCHITLDNNEGKAVTHTRDTQEIKLKEGLQMLSIFKKYSAVTSLLDDMDFYEEREKSLRVKKEHKPATLRMDLFKEKDYDYEVEGNRRVNQGRGYNWSRSSSSRQQQSLVNLTKNLSIRGGYSVSRRNTGHSTYS